MEQSDAVLQANVAGTCFTKDCTHSSVLLLHLVCDLLQELSFVCALK